MSMPVPSGAQRKAWRPIQGPQERFLRCSAFEAFYGGAAGGGKSEALMVLAARWIDRPTYRGIIFRRTVPELKRYLVDRAPRFYLPLGGEYVASDRVWKFPSGARIELGCMEHLKDRHNYDSAEYQSVSYDELTTFEEEQYLYLITRMRTTDPSIPLRLRAASNPGGPGHEWVQKRFAPWLYPYGEEADDYAGPWARPEERLAFYRADDEEFEQVVPASTHGAIVRTFFPATAEDNPYIDALYKERLRATDLLTYEQKCLGNWMARPAPGMFFRRDMFEGHYLDAMPVRPLMRVRYWDLAATPSDKDTGVKDLGPDWTSGVRMSRSHTMQFVVEDVARARVGPDEIEGYIVATANADAEECGVGNVLHIIEQEPGASGKIVARSFIVALAGHNVRAVRPTGSKIERAKPAAAQARCGNLYLVRAPWNRSFLAEAEMFPKGKKDQIDGLSGCTAELAKVRKLGGKSGGKRPLANAKGGF